MSRHNDIIILVTPKLYINIVNCEKKEKVAGKLVCANQSHHGDVEQPYHEENVSTNDET